MLRLSLRPVLDATEADDEQRVDVCLSPEGWLKADHFYDKFASSPAAYGVVLLLTTWARGVGLVRSSGAQAPAAGAGEAALVPGEWQALLLYLLETDDALQKTVAQCARPSGLRTAKVEARLVQLMDFAQSAAHQDYMDLGRLLHAFLAALRNLKEEAVRFEWPITDRPYHELFRGACKMVASCSKHAAEILAASRRVQTMLRSCSENTGASIARRLSRALSHRLYSHLAFHETYLREVSGAQVKLEAFDGSDVLDLSASGTRSNILELQRQLRRYTTAALALGMPSTKASRYFMEGSTRLLFAGAINLTMRVRFVEFKGAYLPLHAACERMLPCLNSIDQTCGWEDLAMQRFLDLWTSQLSKLRANSIHLLDVLAVRVRFGTMYVNDVTSKLPETTSTWSIADLEEAVVKNRRNRKTAERTAPEPAFVKERSSEATRPDMVLLRPAKGSAGQPLKKGKKQMRKRKQCGLGNTFCPGLFKDNQPSDPIRVECWNRYHEALVAAGFEKVDDPDKQRHWTLSISASSTFEIDWGLDESLQTIFINERPLCWVHATLVANRSGCKYQQSTLLDTHDLRIKVETAEAIKTGSKLYDAVVANTRPIRINGGIPAVDSTASTWLRERLSFARRVDSRQRYRKRQTVNAGWLHIDAVVCSGEEFMGRDLGLSRKFCELSLQVQATDVKLALEQGMLATRSLGEMIWKTAREVSCQLSTTGASAG